MSPIPYFPVQFGAIVRDNAGNPVGGAAVSFKLDGNFTTDGWGYYTSDLSNSNYFTTFTGSDGIAMTPARMVVTKDGVLNLRVEVPGAPVTPVGLTGLPGGVDALQVVSGDNQQAIVNTTYALPWQVRALGADGLPVPHAALRVFVDPNPAFPGGTFGGLTHFYLMADANGVATTPPFTANAIAGQYSGWLSGLSDRPEHYPFLRVYFANWPPTLRVTSLDEYPAHNAPIGGTTWAPYRAVVRNLLGQPVEGAAYTFQADAACARFGGQASYSGLTGADGAAVSPLLEAVAPSLDCRTHLTVEGAENVLPFSMHTFMPEAVAINTYPASLVVPARTRQGVWGTLFADGRGVYLPMSATITEDRNGASASVESMVQEVGSPVANVWMLTNSKAGDYEVILHAGPARTAIPITQRVGRIN